MCPSGSRTGRAAQTRPLGAESRTRHRTSCLHLGIQAIFASPCDDDHGPCHRIQPMLRPAQSSNTVFVQRSDGLHRLRHLHCACPSASPPVGDPNVSCNVQYTTRLKGHDVSSDLTWPAGVMCGRLAGSLFVNASAVFDTGGCAAALGGASGTTSSLAPEQWAIMPCCSALSDI